MISCKNMVKPWISYTVMIQLITMLRMDMVEHWAFDYTIVTQLLTK